MVGLLSLTQLIPLVITALLGGALADHYNRRKLMIIAEFFLAIGCLSFALNAILSTSHIWLIFLTSAYMSVFSGLHWPAVGGITQQIVNKKDFASVGALSSFMYSSCMIAGPTIGGLIIAHFGLVTTYLVDFTSFIVSLGALSMLRSIERPVNDSIRTSAWTSIKQGFSYAFSRKELLGSYLVDFVAMIFGMPTALFPAIAQSFGGVEVLGMLYSAPAVGSLIISLFSGWTKHIKRYGVAISVAALFWGVAIIFFGLSTNLWGALLFLALAGALDTISGIFRSVMWNESIPNEFRSRLAGIEIICVLSGPKLGDTEAGLVAAAFGVTASVVSGGVLCVIGVLACCYLLPKFWKYKSEII